MALRAVKKDNQKRSMTQTIEDAFKAEWLRVMQNGDGNANPKPPDFNAQMQIMFVAIAQGVIQHLKENPDAFVIKIESAATGSGTHTHAASLTIATE